MTATLPGTFPSYRRNLPTMFELRVDFEICNDSTSLRIESDRQSQKAFPYPTAAAEREPGEPSTWRVFRSMHNISLARCTDCRPES